MKAEVNIREYLRLSDIMYQAIKARKFEIFESALKHRQKIINILNQDNVSFSDLSTSEKRNYRLEIRDLEEKIKNEIYSYRHELESELAIVHGKKAQLRKRSNIKKYNQNKFDGQGAFFNKLK